jgi:hypothetical protein
MRRMNTIENMCESSICVKISCGKNEKHLQYVKKAVRRMKNIENMYDKELDAPPPHAPSVYWEAVKARGQYTSFLYAS